MTNTLKRFGMIDEDNNLCFSLNDNPNWLFEEFEHSSLDEAIDDIIYRMKGDHTIKAKERLLHHLHRMEKKYTKRYGKTKRPGRNSRPSDNKTADDA